MALSKDQEDWFSEIKSDEKNVEKVPKELLTEEFCLTLIQETNAFQYFPDALKTEAMYAAVQHPYPNSYLQRYISEAPQDKMEAALKK